MKSLTIFTTILMLSASPTLLDTGAKIIWTEHLTGDFSFARKKSIKCAAWCYEWAGTKSITAKGLGQDSVFCETEMNEATHCSLHLTITKNSCVPTVNLLSVAPNGRKVYPYKSGQITIDSRLWTKHILKADFSFDFYNAENDKRIFWRGKIFTKID